MPIHEGPPDALTLREWVRGGWLVAAREMGATLDSTIAYAYTIAFVALANGTFMNEFFLAGRADMTPWFDALPLLLAFFIPAVTMRLWAEERKQRTIELLLTLPIRPAQAIAGKLAAALGLYALSLACSTPIVVMLASLGDPDLGRIAAGYAGALLLGAQLLAIGMLVSSITGDQIVAFVLSAVVCCALVVAGNDKVAAVLDGLAPSLEPGTFLLENVSVVPRFDAFVRGVVDLPSVLYFLLTSAALLWAQKLVLERLRS